MALIKFMGPPDTPVGSFGGIGANDLISKTYISPYSGIITAYRAYSTNSSAHIKAALYEYNGSTYDILSSDETAQQFSGTGWELLTGLNAQVIAGNDYNPAAVTDIYGGFSSDNGIGDTPRRGHTFSNALPDGTTFPVFSINRDCPIQVWGYPVPGVTSIDGDNNITTSQTGVAIVGTNLIDSAGSPTLELCNNSDYASATVKVSQTVNSTSDTGINFDVVQGALSTGTVYAFVTTALGQLNSIGFAVTLSSGVSVPEVTGEMNISSQSISGSVVSVPSVSGDIEITLQNSEGSFYSVPYISGDINISSQNTDGQILSIPVVSGEISVSSQNVDGAFVSIPVVSGDIQISLQNIDGLVEAVSAIPILSGLLNVSAQSADGQIDSINVISGQMEIAGQNTDGSLTSVVTFEGNMNVSGNNISGTFEAIITIPTVTGEMIISSQSIEGSTVSVPSVSGDMELSEYQINGLFVSPGRLVYLLKIIDDDRIFKVEG